MIAIAIPLVLAATFAIMYELGIRPSAHLARGADHRSRLLVDDAMIVVEMMEPKLEEGLEKIDAAQLRLFLDAFSMLTGTLITTAALSRRLRRIGPPANMSLGFLRRRHPLVVSWFVAVYFTPGSAI